uniref:Uncharacterized protein n=1 Tax=Oryza sativa subsp. japonica TaxID=39947 RepID=Q5Z6K1_ORYSJ|nr:hypothetical protein [Oryza sativa Japonica Group]BAD68424.1 hypothetical protein [Oryza sativa Japonica Group]
MSLTCALLLPPLPKAMAMGMEVDFAEEEEEPGGGDDERREGGWWQVVTDDKGLSPGPYKYLRSFSSVEDAGSRKLIVACAANYGNWLHYTGQGHL